APKDREPEDGGHGRRYGPPLIAAWAAADAGPPAGKRNDRLLYGPAGRDTPHPAGRRRGPAGPFLARPTVRLAGGGRGHTQLHQRARGRLSRTGSRRVVADGAGPRRSSRAFSAWRCSRDLGQSRASERTSGPIQP